MNYGKFRQALMAWYDDHGRVFYWRENKLDTFDYLITEMLLKRTNAETVDNYGESVLNTISGPETVVAMDNDALVELIQPFGLYNRRSKNLKMVCRQLIEDHDGRVPDSREALLAINGIGEYTADAVMCFAYGEPVVLLDTNTAAVAEVFFGVVPEDDLRLDRGVRPALKPLITMEDPRKINWALLDLGADIIARERRPKDYRIPDMASQYGENIG